MRGQSVELTGVSMRFGDFTAVAETDLTIRAGEFFSILGPSGCGKTTLLRIVSGFLTPSGGRVAIGGETVNHLSANRRPTAMIFQNLALFPLMKVWENVAFGLEARGVPKAARRKRADELLELVALTGHADKRPTELSGGQRQRVAIARALAVEPAVLCLDEPLSALDLKLRQHMRTELKAIQRATGVTFIYITHDQGEALAMSDRIAVMHAGRIEQVGPADEVYDRPETPFVATFVGEQNVLSGRITRVADGMAAVATPLGEFLGRNTLGLNEGDAAMLMVRPERMVLDGEARNAFGATLERRDLEGPFVQLVLSAGDQLVSVQMPNVGRAPMAGAMRIGFAPEDAIVMPPDAEAIATAEAARTGEAA
ncbi:ABC transporter ATP-binding protein [Acuticoccus sediminis]|uniref:ABC transporter ATP-binding protein n=1 Tax=Acuticoccus sediminis TaxID=2184697 RepID=UPI001CFCCABA|nr:ABC transporter ATP-binding protein [Acuticoccus sediminis]